MCNEAHEFHKVFKHLGTQFAHLLIFTFAYLLTVVIIE